MTWAGLVLLSPGRDVAVGFWLPGRGWWWRLAVRMLGFVVVFVLVVLVPSVVLALAFEVDLWRCWRSCGSSSLS